LDQEAEGRELPGEYVRGEEPFYIAAGDPDDLYDPLNRQAMNIPAVVQNHLRAMGSDPAEKMRTFTIRVEEADHTRLVLLAEALGTSKTTLARELLSMAMREATHSLPEEMREELWRKFKEAL
jgi:2-phosphoglycerate kinase